MASEVDMRTQFIAAVCAGLFVATPLLAQTPTSKDDKAETSCNTASSTAPDHARNTTGTSTGIEKSAILPSAGGHANSAAPTVQSDGKPMEVRPDCPPESKK
jgi:hypothetical protein